MWKTIIEMFLFIQTLKYAPVHVWHLLNKNNFYNEERTKFKVKIMKMDSNVKIMKSSAEQFSEPQFNHS